MTSTSEGLVLITGQGGTGESANRGVYIDGVGSDLGFGATISTSAGDLHIFGLGGANVDGTKNDGVLISNTAEIRNRDDLNAGTTDDGNILIQAQVALVTAARTVAWQSSTM